MSNIYGLIGEKLSHSFSPQIHEAFFQKTGATGKYGLFEVKRELLTDAVRGLKALGIKGANVTIPYKAEIMKYLDDISEEAKKIGAVNTLIIDEYKISGANTDYYGFGMMLKKYGISPAGKTAVILGTGGASKAVVCYLLDSKAADIILVSRSGKKKDYNEVFRGLKVISYEELADIKRGDILINCTPVGMYPKVDASPVSKDAVSKFGVVVDVIYNPLKTLLLQMAEELNIPAINGIYMLAAQAAKSQEMWHNIAIYDTVIDQVIEEALKDLLV